MPLFEYTARDAQGQLVRDTLTCPDERTLRTHLKRNELFLVEVTEKRGRPAPLSRRRVGLRDLILMTRQLRTMVRAGMPLVAGLEALADQSVNRRLGQTIAEVSKAVGRGMRLADAMEQYPQIFPELLVTLVRTGEEGGRLPEALQEACRQMELQLEIRQKVISAMIYPAFTLLVTAVVLVAMMVWIVPTFAQIYRDLNATLPPLTLWLVWASEQIMRRGWIGMLVGVALWGAWKRYARTPQGRVRVDRLRLRMPVFGVLFLKSASANFTGSLAGLLESGLPLLQALRTCASVCGNEVIATAVRECAASVALGRRLSDELERTGHFPQMVTRMIAMAEVVGTLPEVLREISQSYIEDVEYAIRRITSVIEPAMILIVGAIIGFLLVALYWPIFNLGSAFLSGG
ncbi:MAG: type II secretion system F family protein [Chloroherpetonaceae bacterium]|nr:type II secretion system F family protein [Chthonomonadaceae bacterium]MDW8206798.1 type II secretion system F family protein [Chloroherpetonaceae bacterium]